MPWPRAWRSEFVYNAAAQGIREVRRWTSKLEGRLDLHPGSWGSQTRCVQVQRKLNYRVEVTSRERWVELIEIALEPRPCWTFSWPVPVSVRLVEEESGLEPELGRSVQGGCRGDWSVRQLGSNHFTLDRPGRCRDKGGPR